MKQQDYPEIRNDDVLQTLKTTTSAQRRDLEGRTLFEAFLEADKVFEEYDYPCTLAVLAEGIDEEPEWVEHILKNKDRYVIELHGDVHKNYRNIPLNEFWPQMSMAKNKIEKTFDVTLTTWYPPFGRKGERERTRDVTLLGLEQYYQHGKVDAKFWLKDPDSYPHVNFHYWNRPQVEHVREILCRLQEKN
jgi:peptidoglycan/xylan/chitin deacetylase (PgdA/CDA1 family)